MYTSHTDIPPTGCKEGDIRLVTRFQEGVGFVQICFNNTWYMLCRDTFGSNEAEVVCNQLGYVTNGRGKYLHIIVLYHHYFDHSYTRWSIISTSFTKELT